MQTDERSDEGGTALGVPHVIAPAPGQAHACTLIFLHGFTVSAADHARSTLKRLRRKLPADIIATARLVFLSAPTRAVSCYGTPRPCFPAWHDYYTDHGGDEGRPELEEEIDVLQLEWCRAKVPPAAWHAAHCTRPSV